MQAYRVFFLFAAGLRRRAGPLVLLGGLGAALAGAPAFGQAQPGRHHADPHDRGLQLARSEGRSYSTITPPASVAPPANPASPAMPSPAARANAPMTRPAPAPDKVYRAPGNAPQRQRPAYTAPSYIEVQPVVPIQPRQPHRPGQHYPYRPYPQPGYPAR
ncbi:hypothetical protein V8Z80_19050, partial [Orrella sp. JC864]